MKLLLVGINFSLVILQLGKVIQLGYTTGSDKHHICSSTYYRTLHTGTYCKQSMVIHTKSQL